MSALNCPACAQPCFSAWAKLNLGPARTVRCRCCGCVVGVPWLSAILVQFGAWLVPFLFSAAVTSKVLPLIENRSIGTFAALFVGPMVFGYIPFGWAYVRFVPLIAKGE